MMQLDVNDLSEPCKNMPSTSIYSLYVARLTKQTLISTWTQIQQRTDLLQYTRWSRVVMM